MKYIEYGMCDLVRIDAAPSSREVIPSAPEVTRALWMTCDTLCLPRRDRTRIRTTELHKLPATSPLSRVHATGTIRTGSRACEVASNEY